MIALRHPTLIGVAPQHSAPTLDDRAAIVACLDWLGVAAKRIEYDWLGSATVVIPPHVDYKRITRLTAMLRRVETDNLTIHVRRQGTLVSELKA